MNNEEEGSQTPPAPESESSDQQTPPDPEEGTDEGGSEDRRPRLLPVWVLLGAVALSGGAWAVTEYLGGGPPPDEAQVPLIIASAEPWKVRPDDPGGMEIPNQGTLIYETLTTADPEEAPERILPSPEEPMSPPRPEADDAEQAAAPAAASETGASQPAPVEGTSPSEAPDVPELAAVEQTSSEPAWVEETRAPEPDPVEESAMPELEAQEGVSIVLPPPPKPRAPERVLADAGPPLEPEAPSESTQQMDAGPVPIPVFKPVRVARAEQPSVAAAAPQRESGPSSTARLWRYVQLGTASSRGPLESHWEMLRRNYDDAIVGLSPLIMPVDRGDAGIFYRLRAGPLSDEESARWVCAQLKARGLECFPGIEAGVTAGMAPRATILGCTGTALDAGERRFLADTDPAGFILFTRNCESPAQTRALIAALREAVGRADAPVLIDQEGGRVARLGPPHWRVPPAPAALGALAEIDAPAGARAAWLNARLVAADLFALGITVNCVPVLDLRFPGASKVVGDRSFGADPPLVARLGRAVADGLRAGGIVPAIKHLPGHGRSEADSHAVLPQVDAPLEALRARDFAPFRALRDVPVGLTSHVCYAALDPERPGTLSAAVIGEAVRREIGFGGLLVSDDLSMGALTGPVGARAAAALAAGCDLALHCNSKRAEMEAVAAAVPRLGGRAMARFDRMLSQRRAPDEFDECGGLSELEALLERVTLR